MESLARCIKRIEEHIPANLEQLQNDFDMQDIIMLNLERAIQQCVDIASHILIDYETQTPKTMADTIRELAKVNVISDELAEKLARAVGFRNIAVHQYHEIDYAVVMSIVTKNLNDFRNFASSITKES